MICSFVWLVVGFVVGLVAGIALMLSALRRVVAEYAAHAKLKASHREADPQPSEETNP